MDPSEYLQEGKLIGYSTENGILTADFDVSSLKVAQLRGVLFDNGVEFPSNARKKELVLLFHEKVRNGPKKPNKKSKVRDLEIWDAPPLKSADPLENIDELVSTPDKKANDSESGSTKGKKRKSTYSATPLKFSDSPTKGNVFEIDTDSDSEILSPRKKSKSTKSTPLKVKTTSLAVNSPSSTPSKTSRGSRTASNSLSKTPSKLSSESGSPVKSESVDSPKSEKADSLESTSDSATRTPVSKTSHSPQVKKETPEGSSNRLDESATNSLHSSFQTASPNADSSVDNALGFDLALKKLKRDDHFNEEVSLLSGHSFSRDSSRNEFKKSRESREPKNDSTDVELARLLGVDLQSVKPKPKGRRVISPRNPIIILKKRLAYTEDLSEGSEVEEKKDNEANDEVHEKEEERESDEDLDSSEEESDEETEKETDKLTEEDSENESQEESEEEASQKKPGSKLQKKKKAHPRKSSFRNSVLWFLFSLLSWTILAAITLFAYWYREQTFLVGYCGQEIYKPTIPNTPDTPDFLVRAGAYLDNHFKPQCASCPQHARCFPNLEMGCYDDFVEFTPWYFPYMPVVDPTLKKCIPDTKRAEKIEIMIDVALDLLRARNAHINCGESSEDDVSAGIEMKYLHDLLLAMKAPYITLEEFEELWQRSVEELEKEPEIIVRQVTDLMQFYQHFTNQKQVGFVDHVRPAVVANDAVAETETTHKVFRSTSLSHVSLKCQLSNTMVSLVVKFKITLVVCTIGAVAFLIARAKYNRYKLYHLQINTLYKEVLSKLQRQARLSRESSELPGYIGSIQLRDLILSDESNLAHKMRLWEAVSRKVDRNTNVSHRLIEIHGEVMKVWEWISNIE